MKEPTMKNPFNMMASILAVVGTFSSVASADTIPITGPDSKIIEVTETEAGEGGQGFVHTVTIHNTSQTNFGTVTVTKKIPKASAGEVGVAPPVIKIENDPNFTVIQVTLTLGPNGKGTEGPTFTYRTAKDDVPGNQTKPPTIFPDTVAITISGTNYPQGGTGSAAQNAPKKPGKTEQLPGQPPFPGPAKSQGGHTIVFDSPTGTLTIQGDSIIETPVAFDPILGAAVNFPDFMFMGFTLDGVLGVFSPINYASLTVTNGSDNYERADMPFLFYDIPDNIFYGSLIDITLAGVAPSSPFYDPTLANISSPFLNSLDVVLNPSSPGFDPAANLYFTITPDTNFFMLTNGFTLSGGSSFENLEFPAAPAGPVPEPSSLVLVTTGAVVMCRKLFKARGRRTILRAAVNKPQPGPSSVA